MDTQMRLYFGTDASQLLLRYIDDYLFVTCDLARAKEFLAVMKKGESIESSGRFMLPMPSHRSSRIWVLHI